MIDDIDDEGLIDVRGIEIGELLDYAGRSGLDRALDRLLAASKDRECRGFQSGI